MMETKKTKTKYNENTREKKSNSKTNHVKDKEEKDAKENQIEKNKRKNTINQMKSSNKATHIKSTETPSTSSNTKIKTVETEDVTQQVTETTLQNSPNLLDNNEGRLTESSKKSIQKNQQIRMCSVILEDIKSQVNHHGPMEKISETLNYTKNNKNSTFEVQKQMKNPENQFEPKISKNIIYKMKDSSNAKQVEPTNMPSQTSKKNKNEQLNKKMKTEEPEATAKNSSNLPNENKGILIKNVTFEDIVNKKTKRSSFNEISNGPVQKKTKSITKSHHLKNTSKSIGMEEKDATENQIEKNKRKNTINQMKSSNKATHIKSTETPSTSSNTKIKTVEPEDVTQQVTETTIQNSPDLLDNNNEGRFTESFILEAENHGEQTSTVHNTIMKMRNRRPSCIIHAYYQRPSNANKYKRKLSDVKELLNNYLKRFKPS